METVRQIDKLIETNEFRYKEIDNTLDRMVVILNDLKHLFELIRDEL